MTTANHIAQSAQPTASALDQLPPLALPEPITLWPPAIGWWILLLITIAGFIALVALLRKRRRNRAPLRAASFAMQTLYAEYIDNQNAQDYLHNSSQLLRRFCQSQYNDSSLTTLSGEAWLAAMDAVIEQPLLNTPAGQQLLAVYQPNAQVDIHSLHTLLLRWLAAAPLQAPKVWCEQ
jgi:hypothetical protein